MNTVVLLLSKQALPNLSFVKLLKAQNSPIQRYILIGSDFTEKNKFHLHLIEALGLKEGEYELWKIDAESYAQAKKDLAQQLAQAQHQAAQKFWLHLTGGTKMMAMAAQDSFKKHSKTTKSVQLGSYYMPFGGKVLHKIYPQAKSKKIAQLDFTLKEYFGAYGYKIKPQAPKLSPTQVEEIWTQLQTDNFDKSQAIKMAKLPKSGDFWEEIIYNFVKQKYQLEEQQIACGLEFKPLDGKKRGNEDGNELDIVFLKNDQLYIIECKALNGEGEGQKKFPGKTMVYPAIYKAAALSQNLGLNANNFLAVACPISPAASSKKRINVLDKEQNVQTFFAQELAETMDIDSILKIK